jgi:hypothetical protein
MAIRWQRFPICEERFRCSDFAGGRILQFQERKLAIVPPTERWMRWRTGRAKLVGNQEEPREVQHPSLGNRTAFRSEKLDRSSISIIEKVHVNHAIQEHVHFFK